ncbi:quinoprotein dehydrogenase-associated putative ABC transporter substrate-binding protein [Hyphomicrobium sp. xq]|uniref:Quinoprotein dehydrogenase-associated putative ABC transporter substrate-binding protein n=1 Tax=Hyphomicrobium album TaxID=2665159 RepID=A0A6I3KN66_9HYPH|nr:quinoprotein dehydrogenase-associated putative ABC transporter substrate-binding protein [Hyphomicrobium album]MTD94131.1 quinoprotein dehydrogenase-associated putative ABC transporter substrate-binding protein [Hyphomicrobium album]
MHDLKRGSSHLLLGAVLFVGAIVPALAARDMQKNFNELTSAEKTAAKRAAKKMYEEKSLKRLVVCADPGNMPLSDVNQAGYQNKIAEVIAKKLGAGLEYFWRPYLERGLTRETFDTNMCDVLLDLPAVYEPALTTIPIYKSTYAIVYRNDRGFAFKDFDDPALKGLKIGVFQTSSIRQVMTKKGLAPYLKLKTLSHNADLHPENQPWRQVQEVIDGTLDVAAVWGPFAGWLKTMKGEPITLQPVNLWEDIVPMEYELAAGVPKTDAKLKYLLDLALEDSKAEIEKILTDYGVPLVQCSTCLVQGNLPSHGAYIKPASLEYKAKPESASPDQVVTEQKLEAWLAEGADLTQELSNAVLASDQTRIRFLVKKGADINARDPQGYAPVHTAARKRHPELIALFAELGADLNEPDGDGMTPLQHAVMRNHVPSVKMLLERGADIEKKNTVGYSPLALAIAEAKFEVAKVLLEAGAHIDAAAGPDALTPLMIASSQVSPGEGAIFLPESTRPIDLARDLIKRGADVNAQSKSGVTALMIAAARNVAPMIGLLIQAGAKAGLKSVQGQTAADIADQNGAEAAAKALKLIGKVSDEDGH